MDPEKAIGAELAGETALESVRPELEALGADELLPIKLDVSGAVTTVLSVLPGVRGLREQIRTELPTFNLARFDKLETYALALAYAQAAFLSAAQAPGDLDELVADTLERRVTLLAEVRLLVQHGIVSDERLAQLKGAKGHKNIAADLMLLANLLRETWPRIEGKLFTTAHDLERAVEVSSRLLRIVRLREQAPAQVAEAMEQRVRAFTLLSRAYEDARRAVTYLRAGAGDADVIAPSLYPGRPRPRKPTPDGREFMPAESPGERPAR